MLKSGLLAARLANQRLSSSSHATPADAVAWLGAVQAQDYAGAAWALALRVPGLTFAGVERALAAGRIIRTHVLRPTWHFVAPADLRWMLALTGPRVRRVVHAYDARFELPARLYAKAHEVFARALEGGRHLTRTELAAALRRARITVAGQRLARVVMDAELSALICSGPRRGAQFTYALVDERVPPTRPLSHDEALAALATRFFRSHGPATAHDFAWWSGLTVGDARRAAALATIEAAVLAAPPAADRARGAHYLLPNYDEYLVAYRHRGAVIDPGRSRNLGRFTRVEYPHQVVLHGRVAGSWQRTIRPRAAVLRVKPYAAVAPAEARALARAAQRFGKCFAVRCDLTIEPPG